MVSMPRCRGSRGDLARTARPRAREGRRLVRVEGRPRRDSLQADRREGVRRAHVEPRASPDDAKIAAGRRVRPARGGRARRRKVAAPNHADYKDAWIAYTDGACSGNPGPAGCGTIVIAPGGKIRRVVRVPRRGDEQHRRAQAILHALVVTPSKDAARAPHRQPVRDRRAHEGVEGEGEQELIARIRKALAPRKVRFVYVPGHAGVPLNERADELAREAIKTRAES